MIIAGTFPTPRSVRPRVSAPEPTGAGDQPPDVAAPRSGAPGHEGMDPEHRRGSLPAEELPSLQ
ncbi:MAG: hypothetical protein JWQ67_2162 [Marmoricola sp.]|jgi:hypothetical protein|nr:hypothetical protein [Marmoricola sp.]MCW2828546.1 hypothetical protein [Marmoricola sp.]